VIWPVLVVRGDEGAASESESECAQATRKAAYGVSRAGAGSNDRQLPQWDAVSVPGSATCGY
jgi:hypothetical protein